MLQYFNYNVQDVLESNHSLFLSRIEIGTNAHRQSSIDLSTSDVAFPPHVTDPFLEDESQMNNYDIALDVLSYDAVSRVGNDHPLDQSVEFGSSGDWSRIWADDLCSRFSFHFNRKKWRPLNFSSVRYWYFKRES